jgi:putative acetyltransferase
MTEKDRHLLIERFLGNWFPQGVDTISERLPGGDLNDVYRINCHGQAFVLRIYNRAATREMVECEHAVVGQLGCFFLYFRIGGKMEIREATGSDLNDVLSVEKEAFGYDKEAHLVNDLLSDPSAVPLYSLLAFDNDRAVGHILFTSARLEGAQNDASISLLAPLAVIPDFQKQGIGGKLIERGLQHLAHSGIDLVFVLGHPDYYPRSGFKPAGVQGFGAPYPIPEEHAGAWMVQELRPGVIGSISGKVRCADMLNKPEHWRE